MPQNSERPAFGSDQFPYGVARASSPDAPLEYTEYDVASALAVLQRSAESEEPQEIVTLTDEQILGLDGYRRPQLTAMPWAAEHEEEIPLLAAAGLRSLMASGAATLAQDETTGEQRWVVDPGIDGCLVLRRTADLLCSAERQVNGENGPQTHRLYYYVHEEGVLEEEVTASGSHYFRSLRAEAVPARMVRLIDQDGAASAGGEEVVVEPEGLTADSPLAQELADTRAITIVTSLDTESGAAKQLVMYATTSAVYAMEPPAEENPGGAASFRAVNAEELLETAAWFAQGEDDEH